MMKLKMFLILSVSFIISGQSRIIASTTTNQINTDRVYKKAQRLFAPISKYKTPPKTKAYLIKRIALGKKLFLEKRLSSNNKMSCNTCHALDNFGVDNQATSLGVKGKRGGRNSPTVYNAFMHIAQFWDGREKDVEAQAIGPITNPIEMNMSSPKTVVKKMKKIKEYPALFKAAFPNSKDSLTFKNIGIAIGAFERTLTTPSKFDSYLKGNKHALNHDEINGLNTFLITGCATCHNGSAIGGNMYRKMGLVIPFKTKDKGRYEVTKKNEDKFVFKVPSLRNIEKTAPYFHDGSVKTLKQAIKLMATHQLGTELSSKEVKEIMSFLKTLTGTIN